MKKYITLLFAIAVWGVSSAQNNSDDYILANSGLLPKYEVVYGVGGGVTCPSVTFDGVDVSSTMGFKIGMMWGVDWGRIEFVPELWYSRFSINIGSDGEDLAGEQIVNRSIDLPLLLSYCVLPRVRVNVAPTLSLMCSNELMSAEPLNEFGRIKQSVGYIVGLSANLYRGLMFDVRYAGRFGSFRNEWGGEDDQYNIEYNSVDFCVIYRF